LLLSLLSLPLLQPVLLLPPVLRIGKFSGSRMGELPSNFVTGESDPFEIA
jgi:hypothetical protein